MSAAGRGRGWAMAILMTAAWFVGMVALGLAVATPSFEAHVYEAICRQLAANTTAGRQALVGSLAWPPPHVLLRLPLILIAGETAQPVVSLIVSAGMGALCVLFVLRAGNLRDSDWFRWMPVLLLVLAPGFVTACVDGSDTTTGVFATIYASYAFGEWLRSRRLRALMRFAIGISFILAAQPALLPWVGFLLVVLLLDMLLHVRERGRRGAALIVAILPLAYVAALWWLANWIIMGDGLFFVRALSRLASEPAVELNIFGLWHWIVAAWLAGIGLILAAASGRHAVYLVLAALVSGALAATYEWHGFDWVTRPLAVSFAGVAAVSVAAVSAGSKPIRLLAASSLVPALFGFWLAVSSGEHLFPTRAAVPAESLAERLREHVSARSPYATMAVCGYEGLILCDPSRKDDVLVPSFDMELGALRKAYAGRDLFVLIGEPRGRSVMDNIHWRYDRPYAFGLENTLLDSVWPSWRLFEVVQASEMP